MRVREIGIPLQPIEDFLFSNFVLTVDIEDHVQSAWRNASRAGLFTLEKKKTKVMK